MTLASAGVRVALSTSPTTGAMVLSFTSVTTVLLTTALVAALVTVPL